MIRFKTDVLIQSTTPEEVYTWWLGLNNERYTLWHNDHLYWRWNSDGEDRGKLGDSVIFGEMIDSYVINFKGKVVDLRENEYIRFDHSFLPVSVEFIIDSSGSDCILHYELKLGVSGPIGIITDPIIRFFYPKEKFGLSLLRHVTEENSLIPEMNKRKA